MILRSLSKRVAVTFAALRLILALFVSVSAYGQVTGANLSGTINDKSGGAISNATVSIKNTATGVVREVTVNSAGFYTAPNLLPGTYDVSVSATGFSTAINSNLVLAVGEQQTLNVTMQVGEMTQRVEVAAEAPTVELSSATLSGQVDATTVRELPLNGRDWTSLASLEAGVVTVRVQASATATSTPRGNRGFGLQLSAAGHRPFENNFRINGISVNDWTNGGPGSVLGIALGVDAIQEFSVLTSNYTAEYGRSSGGIINAITKSGTNGFHGDVFGFLRSKHLDSANPFDPVGGVPFYRYQYGVAAGGPIRKGKTFVFGTFERITQQKANPIRAITISDQARLGNLCSIPTGVSPNCTPTTVPLGTGVAPYLGLYPHVNGVLLGNGDTGFYNAAGLAVVTENYATVRLDHKISDKDSLAGSWIYDKAGLIYPDPFGNLFNQTSTFRLTFTAEWTHIFSPSFVNTARAGYNRARGFSGDPIRAINPLSTDPSLGVRGAGSLSPSLSAFSGVTAQQAALGNATHTHHVLNTFQFYDDAFLTRGVHSLKFGFAAERDQQNTLSIGSPNGAFTFTSLTNFLEGMPSVVAGRPLNYNIQEAGTRESLFGAYIQDDWHVRKNLTVNLGMRYEPTTLPTEAKNRFLILPDIFCPTVSCSQNVPTLWPHNQTLRNFAPRIGISWDPFGDGKTAIRSGFGIFDVPFLPWSFTNKITIGIPYQATITVNNPAPTGLPPGAGPFPGGLATQALLVYDPNNTGQTYVEQNPHRNYAMNWNLNIQRQITPNMTVTVSYTGSHTVHQPLGDDNINHVLPTLTSAGYLWPCDTSVTPCATGKGTLLQPHAAGLGAFIWDDSAYYEGMGVQVTKSMSHGFQAQGAFTWGKCFDQGSTVHLGDVFLNSIGSLLFFDHQQRTGPCDFDINKTLVFNYVWNIPSPKFAGAIGEHILGGWQLGGVFTLSNGSHFTPLINGDPLGELGDTWAFAQRQPGCNPVNSNFAHAVNKVYVNLSCFSVPTVPAGFAGPCRPAATGLANSCMNLMGNAGRNSLTGPGLVNFDFSLFKNVSVKRISETFVMQFRTEFFNIFNRANYQAPIDNQHLFNVTGTPAGGAGAVDATATDMRQIQFGMKINW